ncbi:hypothetical protein [Paraburkholderia sp. C35]|uniref:hypothetical protein n=1 Tax=Paraburkholderia sp. C35 TaxID=2126993 RepID=UPI0013A5875F|nr:hypothetical protein [Paraburkholderia sp. C35]
MGRSLTAAGADLTETFAFDPAGTPGDASKIPAYPQDLETEQEKSARFAREAAEDAEWKAIPPGMKPATPIGQ